MRCTVLKRYGALAASVLMCLPAPFPQTAIAAAPVAPSRVTLHYGIEWRLIRAGIARLTWNPLHENLDHARLQLESVGLVSKLFPVDDRYLVNFNRSGCPMSVSLQSLEGSRKRETTITFDHGLHRAQYLERDLVKGKTVLSTELPLPECALEILGGLQHLRKDPPPLGKATQMMVTDGKKLVSARVEAQERESVTTPLGTYNTVRYEAFLFNNILYQRKGRLFIWLTDDERRLPVQIRVQMQLHIGTVTLQLEKEERS